MTHAPSRRLAAEVAFALAIIAASGALLLIATDLPTMSALLPVAMLITLIVLAVILIATQVVRRATLPPLPIEKPVRVIGSFALILSYALAVDFIGFYTVTAVMLPLTAWAFGYRNLLWLAVATIAFLTAIYLIFSFGMNQRFPEELIFQ